MRVEIKLPIEKKSADFLKQLNKNCYRLELIKEFRNKQTHEETANLANVANIVLVSFFLTITTTTTMALQNQIAQHKIHKTVENSN